MAKEGAVSMHWRSHRFFLIPLALALPFAPCRAGEAGAVFPDGSGSFGGGIRIPRPESVSRNMLALSAADFDGDGRIDLAGPRMWGGASLIRQAPGGWDWKLFEIPDADQENGWSEVGDLDGDGLPDLIALVEAGFFSIFYGSESEGFVPGESPLPAGHYSGDVAAADLDGDGVGDLAVGSTLYKGDGTYDSMIEVFLGTRERAFKALEPLPIACFPVALEARDFDLDGIEDLAVLRYIRPGDLAEEFLVEVFGGVGDGTFFPFSEIHLTGDTHGLSAGDVNGDGMQDLIVRSAWGNAIQIFLGMGGLSFATLPPALVYLPWQVTCADLDGDRRDEVLVLEGDDTLEVLRCDEAGSIESRARFLAGGGLAVPPADIDGDGRADAVLFDDKGLVLLRGKGDGTFAAPPTLPTWSPDAPEAHLVFYRGSLAVDDVDGDEVPDLLWLRVVGESGFELALAHGNGDGTFGSPQVRRVGDGPAYALSPFALADLEGDGRKDVLFVDHGSTFPDTGGALRLFPGNGDGTFRDGPSYSDVRHPNSIVVGLIDGDSFPDVAVHDEDGFLVLFHGNGDGTLRPWMSFPIAQYWLTLPFLGDFDEQGGTDLAFTSFGRSVLEVLFADGAGGFERKAFEPSDPGLLNPILLADLSADPPSLIIPCAGSYDRFALTGRELIRGSVVVARNPGDETGALADLDGDGTSELILAGHEDLEVFFRGETLPRLVSPAPAGFRIVAVSDLDRDGTLDVITKGPSIAIHMNPGARFIRGDAVPDGKIDLADPIALLEHLFLGGRDPTGACLAALDGNADGVADLSDAVYLLSYLYLGGSEPAAPFPTCGRAPASVPGCLSPEFCR